MTAWRAATLGSGTALSLALCGCGAGRVPLEPPPASQQEDMWRHLATDADRARLRGWRGTWVTAVAKARAADPAAVAAAGALFAPDIALDRPVPPAGRHRCRVFKLGARTPGMPDFLAYPWFECRIAASTQGEAQVVKLTGSQRQVGTLYRHDDRRAVFLGTLMLADETRALAYGRDPERDLAGWATRVGDGRWRIALPQPAFEALLTVIELVPVG
ncbi:DUF4893 domain-containing protein [Sphingomonas adhaesiva]|uniref:DUF4893 domain-containing protein n=1 Tax=Sphingomonas adhaesiva TaxID=28212 RepID=UPI002FFD185F